MGAGQSRGFRRRARLCHYLRPVGRRSKGFNPDGDAVCARPVPPGDRAERLIQFGADARTLAAPRRSADEGTERRNGRCSTPAGLALFAVAPGERGGVAPGKPAGRRRSEEHKSELQSLMRIAYAVFYLKNKKRHLDYYTLI